MSRNGSGAQRPAAVAVWDAEGRLLPPQRAPLAGPPQKSGLLHQLPRGPRELIWSFIPAIHLCFCALVNRATRNDLARHRDASPRWTRPFEPVALTLDTCINHLYASQISAVVAWGFPCTKVSELMREAAENVITSDDVHRAEAGLLTNLDLHNTHASYWWPGSAKCRVGDVVLRHHARELRDKYHLNLQDSGPLNKMLLSANGARAVVRAEQCFGVKLFSTAYLLSAAKHNPVILEHMIRRGVFDRRPSQVDEYLNGVWAGDAGADDRCAISAILVRERIEPCSGKWKRLVRMWGSGVGDICVDYDTGIRAIMRAYPDRTDVIQHCSRRCSVQGIFQCAELNNARQLSAFCDRGLLCRQLPRTLLTVAMLNDARACIDIIIDHDSIPVDTIWLLSDQCRSPATLEYLRRRCGAPSDAFTFDLDTFETATCITWVLETGWPFDCSWTALHTASKSAECFRRFTQDPRVTACLHKYVSRCAAACSGFDWASWNQRIMEFLTKNEAFRSRLRVRAQDICNVLRNGNMNALRMICRWPGFAEALLTNLRSRKQCVCISALGGGMHMLAWLQGRYPCRSESCPLDDGLLSGSPFASAWMRTVKEASRRRGAGHVLNNAHVAVEPFGWYV